MVVGGAAKIFTYDEESGEMNEIVLLVEIYRLYVFLVIIGTALRR